MNTPTAKSSSFEDDGDAITTLITQDITQNRIAEASQCYMEHIQKLSRQNKDAISSLVYTVCDPAVIPFCFPDLHEPDITKNSPETDVLRGSSMSFSSPNGKSQYREIIDLVYSDDEDAMAEGMSSIAQGIIAKLHHRNIDSAAELYKKNLMVLSNKDRDHISKVLYQYFDSGIIEFYFPYLHEDFGKVSSTWNDVGQDDDDKDNF
jgi:hypothetical protein